MAYYNGMGLLRMGRGLYRVRWGDVRGLHFWKRLCNVPAEARQKFNLVNHRQAIGLCLYNTRSIILQRARAYDSVMTIMCIEPPLPINSNKRQQRVANTTNTTTFIVCLWRIQRAVRAFVVARRRKRAEAFALACNRLELFLPPELVDAILYYY
jgi:hypothetical protein